MPRTYLFIIEITSGLTVLKLTNETKNEIFNICLIILVRIVFFLFERKLHIIKRKLFKSKENAIQD